MNLGNKLVTDYGYNPGHDKIHSTQPIVAFTNWLNNRPEARQILAEMNVDWPVVDGVALNQLCRQAVGKSIRYKGTNGDEYDKANHGKPVEGYGYCVSYHNSHGLCVIVKMPNGSEICVDPIEIEVIPQ